MEPHTSPHHHTSFSISNKVGISYEDILLCNYYVAEGIQMLYECYYNYLYSNYLYIDFIYVIEINSILCEAMIFFLSSNVGITMISEQECRKWG